jgi:signal transduction histidine kinase
MPQHARWLDLIEDGLVLVDAQLSVRFINQAAARYLEVAAEQAIGLPLIAVVRDHRLEQVVTGGEPIEIQTRRRTLAASAVPGGLLLHDRTALREAQNSARELLAVLSHELRTPVTTISSTLEALHYDLPAPQRDRFLLHASTETQRLVRLLNDLTVDVTPPQLRRIALREVAGRAEALLAGTFAQRGAELVSELDDLTVLADLDKLLQVLINLLENAAVHGPADRTITLRAWFDAAEGKVLVTVTDEGEPLPAASIERLFEPNAQGPGVKARGTGLGLYIVRSIASRWGGRAWGRPLAAGNEFGFSVPAAAD